MNLQIRPFNNNDMNDIVQLSLLAWEPVFIAWQQILGPTLYPIAIYPDWRKSQKEAVEKVCHDEKNTTWVAEVEGKVVGFVAYDLNDNTKIGEVQMLAVHADYQIVEVYTPDQDVQVVGIDGTLDGGDVLPGFSLPVREIFKA